MWDRKVLKEKGKAAYRANRITCIFAAFLLAVTSGGVTVDKLDTSDAFTVADEESLGAYLEDANLEAIFEKLLEAGVPEEVIDAMLGSEDAADEQLAG